MHESVSAFAISFSVVFQERHVEFIKELDGYAKQVEEFQVCVFSLLIKSHGVQSA